MTIMHMRSNNYYSQKMDDSSSAGKVDAKDFQLPYDAEGKINWDILGKILTAQLLGEVVYASHVDRKHTDKNLSESFQPDTDWEYCYEKDEVAVFRKKSEKTCFMGRGIINKPMNVVAEFVKDIQSSFIWGSSLVEAQYLKVLHECENETDYIGYQSFEVIQHCGIVNVRRDILYYVRCAFIDGKYVQSAMSVEDPKYPPLVGIPRMTLHKGSGFVAEPYHRDTDKTLLSYIAQLDAKGVPSIVMSQILKKHPMTAIIKIRRNVEKTKNAAGPLPFSEPS